MNDLVKHASTIRKAVWRRKGMGSLRDEFQKNTNTYTILQRTQGASPMVRVCLCETSVEDDLARSRGSRRSSCEFKLRGWVTIIIIFTLFLIAYSRLQDDQ